MADENSEHPHGTNIQLISGDRWIDYALDSFRIFMSCCILIFSFIAGVYAIFAGVTLFYSEAHVIGVLFTMIICLCGLGLYEGLQIAVVEMAHEDAENVETKYPRAAKCMALMAKNSNVQRFLIGRQVLVVFFVFLLARITTYDAFIVDMPAAITEGLMFSGLLGAVLVVIVAQLTPQVLAAAFPVAFLNIRGMIWVFRFALFVEATGIAHAVWLLCYTLKHLCCKNYDYQKGQSSTDLEAPATPVTPPLAGRSVKHPQATPGTSQMALLANEAEQNATYERPRYLRATVTDYFGSDVAEYDEMDSLLEHFPLEVEESIEFDDYPTPQQCAEIFTSQGLPCPKFLTTPDTPDHIPPHIVAMQLLKMHSLVRASTPKK